MPGQQRFPGVFRVFLLSLAALAACACATTDDRLTRLEGAQSQGQQVLDLRISHLEERVTAVETEMGQSKGAALAPEKDKAAPRAVAKGHARRSSEHLAASPVPLRSVEIGALETPSISYLPYSVRVPGAFSAPDASPVGAPVPAPTAPAAPSAAVPASLSHAAVGPAGPGLAPIRLDGAAPPAAASRPQAAPVAPVRAAAPAASKTGSAAYDAALALYSKGDYNRSNEAFAVFLRESSGSSLAPNALYWQGECMYSLGKYDEAILFFKDVASKYPKHAKAAAALLKAGYSYERLKDMENARFYWQILLDDFPGSAPAAMARKRMAAG